MSSPPRKVPPGDIKILQWQLSKHGAILHVVERECRSDAYHVVFEDGTCRVFFHFYQVIDFEVHLSYLEWRRLNRERANAQH